MEKHYDVIVVGAGSMGMAAQVTGRLLHDHHRSVHSRTEKNSFFMKEEKCFYRIRFYPLYLACSWHKS